MIPNVIHYCWFGRNPLPDSARKCIASWRKFFPGYEIKEWNEDNFDVDAIQYTHDAYIAKKYAFVSDYARFWILYKFGGLYFDTDVEIIKSFDSIIAKGPFIGVENDGIARGRAFSINPGLGMGAVSGMEVYRCILEKFHQMEFYSEDGTYNAFTMVPMVTDLYVALGFRNKGEVECIAETCIYPQEYFNPFDDLTGKLVITPNTYSIHWYSKTWCGVSPQRVWMSRLMHRIFGLRIHNLKKRFVSLFERI